MGPGEHTAKSSSLSHGPSSDTSSEHWTKSLMVIVPMMNLIIATYAALVESLMGSKRVTGGASPLQTGEPAYRTAATSSQLHRKVELFSCEFPAA